MIYITKKNLGKTVSILKQSVAQIWPTNSINWAPFTLQQVNIGYCRSSRQGEIALTMTKSSKHVSSPHKLFLLRTVRHFISHFIEMLSRYVHHKI